MIYQNKKSPTNISTLSFEIFAGTLPNKVAFVEVDFRRSFFESTSFILEKLQLYLQRTLVNPLNASVALI